MRGIWNTCIIHFKRDTNSVVYYSIVIVQSQVDWLGRYQCACLSYKTTLYASKFFTQFFLVRESWNLKISTAHGYKYKTKQQAKMKRRQNKNDIFVGLACHTGTQVDSGTWIQTIAYRLKTTD